MLDKRELRRSFIGSLRFLSSAYSETKFREVNGGIWGGGDGAERCGSERNVLPES